MARRVHFGTHDDGQYVPECLPALLAPLREGTADACFGSRMTAGHDALKGGMPLYKFVGNKILSRYENWMLGAHFAEFHSGYRIYSVAALDKVPFNLNTNDFHFDTEIIIQLLNAGQRMAVPGSQPNPAPQNSSGSTRKLMPPSASLRWRR
jgi:hypothetical protein